MNDLQDFIEILCGHFDNTEQVEKLEQRGITDFVLAEHINTVCMDKISGLPEDFAGIFVLEESYYTTAGKTNKSPHLFLFTEETEGFIPQKRVLIRLWDQEMQKTEI